MYTSSGQWDCLTFYMICSALLFYPLYPISDCIHIKPFPCLLLYSCFPVSTFLYCTPNNNLPPSIFVVITQIPLLLVYISYVIPKPPSICIPQSNVIHCPVLCVKPQVKWCTNGDFRDQRSQHVSPCSFHIQASSVLWIPHEIFSANSEKRTMLPS